MEGLGILGLSYLIVGYAVWESSMAVSHNIKLTLNKRPAISLMQTLVYTRKNIDACLWQLHSQFPQTKNNPVPSIGEGMSKL